MVRLYSREQDEERGGDLGDVAGIEADPAQGLEGGPEHGVGASTDPRIRGLNLATATPRVTLLLTNNFPANQPVASTQTDN